MGKKSCRLIAIFIPLSVRTKKRLQINGIKRHIHLSLIGMYKSSVCAYAASVFTFSWLLLPCCARCAVISISKAHILNKRSKRSRKEIDR